VCVCVCVCVCVFSCGGSRAWCCLDYVMPRCLRVLHPFRARLGAFPFLRAYAAFLCCKNQLCDCKNSKSHQLFWSIYSSKPSIQDTQQVTFQRDPIIDVKITTYNLVLLVKYSVRLVFQATFKIIFIWSGLNITSYIRKSHRADLFSRVQFVFIVF